MGPILCVDKWGFDQRLCVKGAVWIAHDYAKGRQRLFVDNSATLNDTSLCVDNSRVLEEYA